MNNHSGTTHTWRALAGFVLVLALLHLFPLSALAPAAMAVAMIGLAWLGYQFLEPFCLVRRRALLKELFTVDSLPRRWFWNGFGLRLILGFTTLVLAVTALMTLDAMRDYEWVVLLASLPVFWLVFASIRRSIGAQWQAQYHLVFALGFAHVITVGLLVVSLVAWQIYVVEVPGTTHLAWQDVLEQAYAEKSRGAVTPQAGWIIGLNAALSDLAWHVIQVARVEDESGRWAYFAGCALLLGWNAAKLASIWLVLLGIIMVAGRSRKAGTDEAHQIVSSKPFIVALAVLAVLFVGFERVDFSGAPAAVDSARRTALDPCEELRFRERRQVSDAVVLEAGAQQRELDATIVRLVDERLNAMFLRAELGVESFLDWNFSVEGQYQQLAYLGASAVASDSFADYIAGHVDEHVHAPLETGLRRLGDEMQAELSGAIEAVFRSQDALAARLVQEAHCLKGPQLALSMQDYMKKSMVGLGAVSGTVGTWAINRLGTRMVGRAAMKRVIAAVAAKGAARTTATIKGGLAGLACGPYAPVCMVGFALTAWAGTDVAINAIDEALHRDEMHAEMMSVLATERESLRQQLRVAYLEVSGQLFQDVREYQARKFNIHRDGG